MDLNERLTPISVALGVRPIKAVLFVPSLAGAPWERMFEAALATQTRYWGGSGNVVMPLPTNSAGDDELLWALLDVCDPDMALVYEPSYTELKTVAPELYEKHLEGFKNAMGGEPYANQLEMWEKSSPDGHVLPDGFASLFVRRTAPLHGDEKPHSEWLSGADDDVPFDFVDAVNLEGLPTPLIDPATNLGEVEQLLLTMEVGRFSASALAWLDAREHTVTKQQLDEFDQWRRVVFGVRASTGHPWTVAEQGLRWYQFGPFRRDPVVIVVGDGPWDFTLCYALRRWTSLAYWLPAGRLADDAFVREVGGAACRFAQRSGRDVAVTSVTARDLRKEACSALEKVRSGGSPTIRPGEWSELLPESPNSLYELDNAGIWQPLLVHDGSTPELLTPLPKQISVRSESQLRWMTGVRVRGWVPIRHASLATLLLDEPNYGAGQMRTTRDGLAYFCPHVMSVGGISLEALTVRPRLKPRDLSAQVGHVLEGAGWSYERSDKGAYAAETAAHFGGLVALATALSDPDVWKVFETYLDRDATVGYYLTSDRRRYLSLDDLRTVTSKAEDVLAFLEGASCVTRGVILKCRRCRAASWYHTEDFGATFRCLRCRLVQAPNSWSWLLGPEPRWHYRLEEVVYQLLVNNGELAVLAAIAARLAGVDTSDAAFELKVTSPDGQISEHDIVASSGYRLWIGEVTKKDRLETQNGKQHDRLVRLQLVAETLDAYGVLLASSAPSFDAKTQTQAGSVFNARWPKMRFVEGFDTGGMGASVV